MTGSVSWCMLGPTVYDGRNTGSPKYVWNSESSHAGVLVVVSSRSTSMAHALLAGTPCINDLLLGSSCNGWILMVMVLEQH